MVAGCAVLSATNFSVFGDLLPSAGIMILSTSASVAALNATSDNFQAPPAGAGAVCATTSATRTGLTAAGIQPGFVNEPTTHPK